MVWESWPWNILFVCICLFPLTLSLPNKFSSAIFLFWFYIQTALILLIVGENVVLVSNSLDLGEMPRYYGTIVVLGGLRVNMFWMVLHFWLGECHECSAPLTLDLLPVTFILHRIVTNFREAWSGLHGKSSKHLTKFRAATWSPEEASAKVVNTLTRTQGAHWIQLYKRFHWSNKLL